MPVRDIGPVQRHLQEVAAQQRRVAEARRRVDEAWLHWRLQSLLDRNEALASGPVDADMADSFRRNLDEARQIKDLLTALDTANSLLGPPPNPSMPERR